MSTRKETADDSQKKFRNSMIILTAVLIVGVVLAVIVAPKNDTGPTGNGTQTTDSDTANRGEVPEHLTAYIGLFEQDAEEMARTDEREARVVERDGEGLPVLDDLRPSRLNFIVKDDRVVDVYEDGFELESVSD